MNSWIYTNNKANTCRYTLGVKGDKVLICCGINPSTAIPNDLDQTVRRVQTFSKDNGYDGYVMINIYPQISTDPKYMHLAIDQINHAENIKNLSQLFQAYPNANIWAAWGNLIEKRPYLYKALREIYEIAKYNNMNWIHFNELTQIGHPRHPLYLKADSKIYKFDIESYIKKNCNK